jgi:Tol biopolymer transport system component
MSQERKRQLVIWLSLVGALAVVAAAIVLFGFGRVHIVGSVPRDGQEAVSITVPLRLTFSQPMDIASVQDRLQIEPEVAGRFVWRENELTYQPESALAPATRYTVTLQAGATSHTGRQLNKDYVWHFETRQPQLLYLGRPYPDATARQLFAAPLDGTPPRQLSEAPAGVWDYAVHPLGQEIVYSVLREDGGSDLWRMDREGANQKVLLACPEAACLAPAWSPDGLTLAYERRNIWADAPNLDPKAGRIWVFDLDQDDTRPLFEYDIPLHSPVWAPRGERLAYLSPMLPGIEVYDLPTGELQQFGNEWGTAPVWSPDGTQLVVPELMLAGESMVVRLIHLTLSSEEATDISGDDDYVKDTVPAWSPAGGWIAFGRQFLDQDRWTPGRQIWLTRPDGSEAYPLLVKPMGDHFAFAWRPDGAALAYAFTDLSEGPQPSPAVSIWIFDLSAREPVHVADDGVLPGWLP